MHYMRVLEYRVHIYVYTAHILHSTYKEAVHCVHCARICTNLHSHTSPGGRGWEGAILHAPLQQCKFYHNSTAESTIYCSDSANNTIIESYSIVFKSMSCPPHKIVFFFVQFFLFFTITLLRYWRSEYSHRIVELWQETSDYKLKRFCYDK